VAELNKYQDNVKLRDLRERIRNADADELRDVADGLQRDMLSLRAQGMIQGLTNPMRIRHNRKVIARIHTELAARAKQAA
jgi:ribosomal protein L29